MVWDLLVVLFYDFGIGVEYCIDISEGFMVRIMIW